MEAVILTTLGALSASLGLYAGSSRQPKLATVVPSITKIELEEELPVAPEDIEDGDLSAIKAGLFEPCKITLVVRTDIKLSAANIATECGTATLACYRALEKTNPKLLTHWERTGQAKIALKGKSEGQLVELEAIAKSLNMCARSVKNPSLTQGKEGDRTVLAIGPAPVPLVNEVTGKLRLL